MVGRFSLALVIALGFGQVALAQDNLESGKSPAQIFASDCSVCHKSPQGLAKSGGLFGLNSFLREHYTSSRETAQALSAYLSSFGDAPAKQQPPKRAAKPAGDKPKPAAKPADAKPGDSKPEATPASAPAEAKPPAEKPPEAKTEAKPEAKPAEGAGDKAN